MEIDYKLEYSDRKTLGLTVERNKEIVLRAPKNARMNDIESFIDRKRYWLYTKLNHPQKYKKHAKTEFISGASILYMGRNYKLDVTKKNFDGIIFNNKFSISKRNQKSAKKMFKDWYIAKAKEKIIKIAGEYANRLGVEYNTLKISELDYRWGSCTPKNNLNFNWKLLKASLPVIKYVIVHELTHLLESNHTPRFWNIVKTQIPNYTMAKKWLRENGHLLEVDF